MAEEFEGVKEFIVREKPTKRMLRADVKGSHVRIDTWEIGVGFESYLCFDWARAVSVGGNSMSISSGGGLVTTVVFAIDEKFAQTIFDGLKSFGSEMLVVNYI